MPRVKTSWSPILKGSLAAGFALALVQVGAGYLVRAFNSNKAVQAFGSIIIVMLVFDLVARLILFIASWIATANQPAIDKEWNDCDEPLLGREDCMTAEGHWEAALADRTAKQATKDDEDGKEVVPPGYTVVDGVARENSNGGDQRPHKAEGAVSLDNAPASSGTVASSYTKPRRWPIIGASIVGAIGGLTVSAILGRRREER